MKIIGLSILTIFMFLIGYLIGKIEEKYKKPKANNKWLEEMIEERWDDGK